jgi:hypothetical protein
MQMKQPVTRSSFDNEAVTNVEGGCESPISGKAAKASSCLHLTRKDRLPHLTYRPHTPVSYNGLTRLPNFSHTPTTRLPVFSSSSTASIHRITQHIVYLHPSPSNNYSPNRFFTQEHSSSISKCLNQQSSLAPTRHQETKVTGTRPSSLPSSNILVSTSSSA